MSLPSIPNRKPRKRLRDTPSILPLSITYRCPTAHVDLTRHLGLAQSTVSRHLTCLLGCGIVQVRPEGRASMYSLAHPAATLQLLAAAEQLLALSGDAVTLCLTHGNSGEAAS